MSKNKNRDTSITIRHTQTHFKLQFWSNFKKFQLHFTRATQTNNLLRCHGSDDQKQKWEHEHYHPDTPKPISSFNFGQILRNFNFILLGRHKQIIYSGVMVVMTKNKNGNTSIITPTHPNPFQVSILVKF